MAANDIEWFGLFEYSGGGKFERLYTPWKDNALEESSQPGSSDKPVLLYAHGWQRGAYKSPAPESFITSQEVYGEERDVAEPWLQAGYRVLCFMWVPFADENDLATAEQKIWTAGKDQVQRWRNRDGNFQDVRGATGIGQAFFEAYRTVVMGAPRIHLVGHSLGTQMVGRLLEQILEQSDRSLARLPERVTLLDPYFSNFAKSYLDGRWTGEQVREAIRQAAEAGCAIEQVASSAVLDNPLSDSNGELRFHTAYFVLNPDFIKLAYGPRDVEVLANRHSFARYAYLASLCSGQQPAVEGEHSSGLASRTDAEVRPMMTSEFHWVQKGGDRWDPETLIFERRGGSACFAKPKVAVQYA